MDWVAPSTLLSNDFELIRSEILSFKYFGSKTQKLASYYLSKNFNCPDRAQWSTEALLLLVYCATDIEYIDSLIDIPSDLSNIGWFARLRIFNTATKKRQVTRDCIFQLFKVRRVTFKELIQEPMLLAALAHRISVHELMSERIEGNSVVTQVLLKNYRPFRYNFLESLYGAYKDDFCHIISRDLSELVVMLDLELKRCLKFLQRTKLRFPHIDFAFAYLHPSLLEQFEWYEVEPVKLSDFNDFYKAVYEESKKALRSTSPAQVIKQMYPYINVIYESQKSKNLSKFVGDTIFPFLELPTEIIEIIILYLDMYSMLALRCVSTGFKTLSTGAKQLMKFQFPRKYHQIHSRPDNASIPWESIYWRDSSILTRWNHGKYSQFVIGGEFKAMDENIVVGSFAKTYGYGYYDRTGFFWMRWDDDTRTKHHLSESSLQISARFKPQGVAIIDSSNAIEPTLAVVMQNEVELFIGTKLISKHQLKFDSFNYLHSCNYKLYIDRYVYTLDERLPAQKVLKIDSELLDVNPLNDMFISTNRYPPTDHSIQLHSAKFEVIGQLFDTNVVHRYTWAKFLDEYRVVATSRNRIDIADIRKMNGIVSTVPNTIDADTNYLIDANNQRVLSMTNRILNIWDLNTCQWSGGFYIQDHQGIIGGVSSSYGPPRANTRYFTYQTGPGPASAVVFDFKK